MSCGQAKSDLLAFVQGLTTLREHVANRVRFVFC
jgi:hypothetical protein